MTKTGDKFTAEERALLINNDVVDAKTLNDLSGQKETLEQLRRPLAAIRASQQMVAQQQAHSSSDDTVIDSGSAETWGISSEDVSAEETDLEEVDLEESDTESYSGWVNSCYNYSVSGSS